MKTSQLILALLVLFVLGAGAYWLSQSADEHHDGDDHDHGGEMLETMPVEGDGGIGDGAESLDELLMEESDEDLMAYASKMVLGTSVNGTDITAHHFGTGMNEVLFIGGVHGADAANTASLGNELIDYFTNNEGAVPENMRVTVIPTMNPDGLASGSRFNENGVDLNRNFACDWAATSQWRDQEVSGGTAAFSEPEAAALRDYVAEVNVVGAVVWFAAEGKVYPSACEGAPSTASVELAATFAQAAGYAAGAEFDAYQINGDMTNWLASQGVPAISVLLTDRNNTELSQNLSGVEAVLAALAN